jgi:hypothetical protein
MVVSYLPSRLRLEPVVHILLIEHDRDLFSTPIGSSGDRISKVAIMEDFGWHIPTKSYMG